MPVTYTRTATLVLLGVTLTAAPSFAQRRQGQDRGRPEGSQRADGSRSQRAEGSQRAERAVPRSAERAPDRAPDRSYDRSRERGTYITPRDIRPRVVVPFRPYSYGNRAYGYPSYGYPFGYRAYAYRPGFSLYFGLPYSAYGYPGYGYGGGYGYYSAVPGRAYGSVRIVDAPEDAQVFVDGYYAGIVDDYDGVFQRLNLEIGPHRIQIESPGYPPAEFDVRIEPGQTITYRAFPRRP